MLLDTPLCDFGWQVSDFTLKDPHGDSFNVKENIGKNGLLLAFICNHCPYVKAVADRLADDANQLIEAGINVLAIMSNDYKAVPEDRPEQMLTFAQKHTFTFPYLIDEEQSVARAYNAVCTPDFFGFNNKGELQYRGRLDDAGMGDASHRSKELVNAMLAISKVGYGPKEQTASMGCSIKWRKP